MAVHHLKIWPEFFRAVIDGKKTAELRLDDRGFRTGDCLHLAEYDPTTGKFTGRDTRMWVTHITVAHQSPGLRPNFVVLSMAPNREDIQQRIVDIILDEMDTMPEGMREQLTNYLDGADDCQDRAQEALWDAAGIIATATQDPQLKDRLDIALKYLATFVPAGVEADLICAHAAGHTQVPNTTSIPFALEVTDFLKVCGAYRKHPKPSRKKPGHHEASED